MQEKVPALYEARFADERAIRDAYAVRLGEFRPAERLWKTEHTYYPSLLRGDMRSVDEHNRIRVWEFKIKAGYDALGQILTYVALARKELEFSRPVLGVLAAFEIPDEIRQAIEILNLGIESVLLPDTLRLAGAAPASLPIASVPQIPVIPDMTTELQTERTIDERSHDPQGHLYSHRGDPT